MRRQIGMTEHTESIDITSHIISFTTRICCYELTWHTYHDRGVNEVYYNKLRNSFLLPCVVSLTTNYRLLTEITEIR